MASNNSADLNTSYEAVDAPIDDSEAYSRNKKFWIGLVALFAVGITVIVLQSVLRDPTSYDAEYPPTSACSSCFQLVNLSSSGTECPTELFSTSTIQCGETTPCCCPSKISKGSTKYNSHCPYRSSSPSIEGKCICAFLDARGDSGASFDGIIQFGTILLLSIILLGCSCIYCSMWEHASRTTTQS